MSAKQTETQSGTSAVENTESSIVASEQAAEVDRQYITA